MQERVQRLPSQPRFFDFLSLRSHYGAATSVQFHPDPLSGLLVSGGEDGTVKVGVIVSSHAALGIVHLLPLLRPCVCYLH